MRSLYALAMWPWHFMHPARYLFPFLASPYPSCSCFLSLQDHAARYAREITDLLGRMPRVLLLLLKTNDCLRCAWEK